MVDLNHDARSLRAPQTDAEKAEWMRTNAIVHSNNLTDEGWAQLYDLEHAPMTTEVRELARLGYEFEPADDLSDDRVHRELWRLLEHLAQRRRVFVSHTDHLSDRAVYIELLERRLTAPKRDVPVRVTAAWQIDLLDGDDAVAYDLYLKYYASDEEREAWAASGETTPPSEPTPHDRDRLLPKPSFPEHLPVMVSIPTGSEGRRAGVYLNAPPMRMVEGT